MKLSDIKNFILGKTSASDLRKSMQIGFAQYKRGAAERGRSRPIILSEDIEILLDNTSVIKFCKTYLEGEFSELELQYIVNALLLSENAAFAKEELRDILESLSDSEVHGPLSREKIQEVIVTLGEQ